MSFKYQTIVHVNNTEDFYFHCQKKRGGRAQNQSEHIRKQAEVYNLKVH